MNTYIRFTLAILVSLSALATGVISLAAQSLNTESVRTSQTTGIAIDLGTSGEAVFYDAGHYTSESDRYTLESFTVDFGTTVVIIDVMDGEVNVDEYMLQSEKDIAATYHYTDWLGGSWTDGHSWDVYSGAYKLDYREIVYLELIRDPESGLYFGIGVYGRAEDIPADIVWLQENVTIDGEGIYGAADSALIESVITGNSEYVAEAVPIPETTVADWEAAGLVSETEWHSPSTSTSFTWDGEQLVFPFSQSDALVTDSGLTTLELRTSDRRGEVRLTTAELDLTPADMVASMTSDEYLQSEADSGRFITILDSRVSSENGSVIMLHSTDFDHPVVLIIDVYVNPEGVTIITEISAAPEDLADVYGIVWDSVQSNGDYYPLTWTIEEIEELNA